MTRRVRILPLAARDVEEYALYLDLEASEEIADRFRGAVERTVSSLTTFPNRGRAYDLRVPGLRPLRSWPVDGFASVFVFYAVSRAHIDIVRVIHGARDLRRVDFE